MTKLNSTGDGLIYSTYLGGSGNDLQTVIAVDASGNAYVAGGTSSTDFPTTAGAFQTTNNAGGWFEAFVTKLNSTGNSLIYSTYLGGTSGSFAHGIAVDASGNAYVTGIVHQYYADFPTTPGAFQTAPGNPNYDNGFVTKFNSTGTALVYSTYLTGGIGSVINSIAVDAAGNAYVAGGATNSFGGFPITAGAFQTGCPNNGYAYEPCAFVSMLNPSGSGLIYCTFLGGGGNNGDTGYAIAVDASGNAWVTGATNASDFPVTPDAFQSTYGGNSDVFVAEVNPSGSSLIYSTYLGGSGQDQGNGVAVDGFGSAYITGFTYSSNFPTSAGALQTAYNAGPDAFVAKIGNPPPYSAQVQQPINSDGSSVFHVRRGVVPVKFTLTLNGTSTCTLPPATIALTRTAGGTIGSIDESLYVGSADTGSSFRIDSCQYVYNLSSSALGPGTYRVDILINSQVVGSGIFGLQ